MRAVKREVAAPMEEIKSLMKILEDQLKGLGECFDQQNTSVRNCLAKFLQTLDVLGETTPQFLGCRCWMTMGRGSRL